MRAIAVGGEYREVLSGVRARLVHCDEGVVIVETLLERGSRVPRHSHDSSQLSIVLRGAIIFGDESRGERVLREGDYAVVPPRTSHWAVALEDSVVLDVNWPLTRDRKEFVERLGGSCA